MECQRPCIGSREWLLKAAAPSNRLRFATRVGKKNVNFSDGCKSPENKKGPGHDPGLFRLLNIWIPERYIGFFFHCCGHVHAQQLFLVEDHLLACQADHVVFESEFDGIHRAGFLAHATVNAAEFIDIELGRVFFAIRPRRRFAHDMNAMRRASRRTHITRHALHPPLLVAVQAMHPAISLRGHAAVKDGFVFAALFRILQRCGPRRQSTC